MSKIVTRSGKWRRNIYTATRVISLGYLVTRENASKRTTISDPNPADRSVTIIVPTTPTGRRARRSRDKPIEFSEMIEQVLSMAYPGERIVKRFNDARGRWSVTVGFSPDSERWQ